MKLKIFYSWQSQTDVSLNKIFIREAIDDAVQTIKKKDGYKDVEFEIIEGTRNSPGSPPVASEIVEEIIPDCDIFIADLSVVNKLRRFSKFMMTKLFREQYRPQQNNNVIHEHGSARTKLGVNRIIGVLNGAFGSPNENPENITFDVRHLKFPIEYNLPNSKNKEVEKVALVNRLIDAFDSTVSYAIAHQKNRHVPFCIFDDWRNQSQFEEEYVVSDKSRVISETILNNINNGEVKSIRLLGLSGLGKTRLLFETFKPNGQQESLLRANRILYINYNIFSDVDYPSLIDGLVRENEDRIIILDNCPVSLHRRLVKLLNTSNNRLFLISIDSNPEEKDLDQIDGVNYILIKKEELGNVVDEIIERDFGELDIAQRAKIKEFSQGIPLMAVLIAKSIKEGEQYIGRLDDKDILDRLLGLKGKDGENRTILKSCSIFSRFGYYDDVRTELKFIAGNKNITSIDGHPDVVVNMFDEVCTYYLKREIFERKGRFLSMRPFPLSMYLAQEWLEPCAPERLLAVIGDIAEQPVSIRRSLADALAEQMKYLGYNDKAVQIVQKITGHGSPFDNAEVLNTELGSRLFRSFVEVNPIAVCENLIRNFSPKSQEELLGVREGRRNLVWILEKLCFDKRTFHKSAKLLCAFAIAENESWANNATGQFLHLFNIMLAGTEATLDDRLQIIEWALTQPDSRYVELGIDAMKIGLGYGQFSRMQGAEQQGVKKLKDFEPTSSDISRYWHGILSNLERIIYNSPAIGIKAATIMTDTLEGIISAGFGTVIIPYIKRVAEWKHNDWEEARIALIRAKKWDGSNMPSLLKKQVDEIINELTKVDFASRYKFAGQEYYLVNEPFSSDKVKDILKRLAFEFAESYASWEENVNVLYNTTQAYSFHFGTALYGYLRDSNEKVNQFISLSISEIIKIQPDKRDLSVLNGFISVAEYSVREAFYKNLFQNESLCRFLFPFISDDLDGERFIDLLFNLVDEGKCEIKNFYRFEHGRLLRSLSQDQLTKFFTGLFKYGSEGYKVVLESIFALTYDDNGRLKSMLPFAKECFSVVGFIGVSRAMDGFKWSELLIKILSNREESAFAVEINDAVIASISSENTYHLNGYIQNLYETLMGVHFSNIWPRLSATLLSRDENYRKFWGLKNILGSHIGGISRHSGIILMGNIDMMFDWCRQNQPSAPARFAELIPIFDKGNSDYTNWHPVALRLINEFGHHKEVLGSLSSNMGTFSWTGSIVPLLKAKQTLFTAICNHPKSEVKNWANTNIRYLEEEILRENNHDAESML